MRHNEKELIPTADELARMNEVNIEVSVLDTLGLNFSDISEEITNEDGTKTEIVKKTYDLANPVGKRSNVTIYDLSVIESMEKIYKALHGKTILTYAICKELSNIEKTNKLESMGFKSISEFGKAFYNFETSTSNHYVRIGENFINDDYTVKGGLPELTVGHFIELSSLVSDGNIQPIIDLYVQGKLVDGMSTKKVREVVKAIKNPQLEDKTEKPSNDTENKEAVTSTGNSAEVIPTSTEMEELKANFTPQVAVGKILNACSVLDELFKMLNENGTSQAFGYEEPLETLKVLAKALI